jgi:D-aminopeptidase
VSTGPLNLLTDIGGLRVGHVNNADIATGVTAIVFDVANIAACVVRGGAPGGRGTSDLEPEMLIGGIDVCLLSGGSVFGLDAAGGAVSYLRSQNRGLAIGAVRVPIAVQAITFDLLNGGNKDWGRMPPYWEMGYRATEVAAIGAFPLGSVGGGYGATTATLKGGLGSASTLTASGVRIAAIAVVNAVGTATIGDGPHFWAAPFEIGNEFGGLGHPSHLSPRDRAPRMKRGTPPSTTIALVVTDAILTKAETKRLAIMADDGLARAVRPAHAPMDGDTLVAVSTLQKAVDTRSPVALTELGQAAGDCLARAIARGVFAASALPFPGALPAWHDKFSGVAPGVGPGVGL